MPSNAFAQAPRQEASGTPSAENSINEQQTASESTFSISGTCLDEKANPLTDIRVALYRVERTPAFRSVVIQETRTDTMGAYQFAKVPVPSIQDEIHTNYVTVLNSPGRASQFAYCESFDRDQTQKVVMRPAATLEGRVTDPQGRPVAGALIWTYGLHEAPLDGIRSCQTDADGHYAITDLEPFDAAQKRPAPVGKGTTFRISGIFIRVRHPDFAQKVGQYTRAPGHLDFKLDDGGTLEGFVIDEVTGMPAKNVDVVLRSTDANKGDNDRQIVTDAQGRYRITGLSPANYVVRAAAADRTCVALESVTIEANRTHASADLKLIEGAWIEGRVLGKGAQPLVRDPKSGQRLRIKLNGPSCPKQSPDFDFCTVDDKGRFRMRVAPGRNYPSILPNDSDLWSRTQRHEDYDQGIEIDAGKTVNLFFRVLPESRPPRVDENKVELPIPVPAERSAADAIRELGGWYTIDENRHVIEVNMVYNNQTGQRYDNNQLTDEVLSHMTDLPFLKRLYLKRTQASNEGLRVVGQLAELETLMMWDGVDITDEGIAHLRNLPQLKTVHLSDSGITDEAIAHLSENRSIERLSMQGNDFTDKAFEYAKRLPRLKQLILDNKPKFTDEGMKHVGEMTMLETLWLQGSVITDKGLQELHSCEKLTSLFLGNDTKVSEAAILQLQIAIPGLRVDANQREFPVRGAPADKTTSDGM